MSNHTAGNRISGNGKLKKIPVLWRRVICILCVAIVIGAVLSVVTFFARRSPAREYVTLQMSFDGAADGIAPNGYRFDIAEMLSDTVLNKALTAASLDQRYSADEIRKCIVIAGKYPVDIVNQTMSYDSLLDFTANRQLTIDKFHPTQFTITLSNSTEEEMSKKEMETLLSGIVDEYKKYFSEVAVMGKPRESSALNLSDYDYAQQLEIIEQRIQIMIDYATELYNGEPSFRNNGSGFNDIAVRLNNLIVNDISRINAKLTLNALTKDSERLLTQYRYELRNINNRLTANENVLKLIDNMVDAYEKAEILYISTQESLTKIDGNSSETYDKLISTRKSIADGNTKLVSRKEDILLKLKDLLGGVNGSSSIGGSIFRFDEDDVAGNTGDIADQGDGNGSDPVDAGNGGNDNGNANDTGNKGNARSDANDPMNWTDAQIVAALQKAASNSADQREALEQEINLLVSRCDAIAGDFRTMLQAWNSQKINDLTLEVGDYKYVRQGIFSTSFIRNGIKTTGPFVALAVIISLIMIIANNVKAEKAEQRAARLGKRNRKSVVRNEESDQAREEQTREQAVSMETEQDAVLWNSMEQLQVPQYEPQAVRGTETDEDRAARIAARRAAETPEERAARIAARRAAETDEERAARIAARRAAETPEERAARRARRAAKLAAERAAAENSGSNTDGTV